MTDVHAQPAGSRRTRRRPGLPDIAFTPTSPVLLRRAAEAYGDGHKRSMRSRF